MRRRARGSVAAAIALLAAACTSGDDGASPRSPSTTRATVTTAASGPSSTPTTGGGAAPDAACAGLGPVPAGGTVTWVADGRLQSSQGCLAAVPAGAAALTWGGAGDRVLVGDTLLQGGGGTAQPLPGAGVALSRPTGTAVIQVTAEGRLLKRDVAGGDVRDISFLARHEAAVYHPAGRNIVSAGTGEGGDTRLVIADNEGRNAVLLVQPDNGTRISNLAFTASGALLFTAAHEGAVVLHRRPLDSDVLTVIDSAEAPDTIDFVTTSPFPGGGVAWTRGRCGPGTRPVTRATRGGRFVDLEGTPVAAARPVGWLPDGSLVATDGGVCAGDEAGRVVVFKDGEASVLTASGRAPAVRAALPPPPEPPAEIPDQAPA